MRIPLSTPARQENTVEINDAIEALKQIIIYHGLPQTDMTLFGITCPYCGKCDRIRKLYPPQTLSMEIGQEAAAYTDNYNRLSVPETSMGVCKFCLNIVRLGKNGIANQITQ